MYYSARILEYSYCASSVMINARLSEYCNILIGFLLLLGYRRHYGGQERWV